MLSQSSSELGAHRLFEIDSDRAVAVTATSDSSITSASVGVAGALSGGAGGSLSLAFAGSLFGIDVLVFQVRVSFDQKPYRRALMETYGARCIASPSTETESGRAILAKDPNNPGSLGIAISEAVEVAASLLAIGSDARQQAGAPQILTSLLP